MKRGPRRTRMGILETVQLSISSSSVCVKECRVFHRMTLACFSARLCVLKNGRRTRGERRRGSVPRSILSRRRETRGHPSLRKRSAVFSERILWPPPPPTASAAKRHSFSLSLSKMTVQTLLYTPFKSRCGVYILTPIRKARLAVTERRAVSWEAAKKFNPTPQSSHPKRKHKDVADNKHFGAHHASLFM